MNYVSFKVEHCLVDTLCLVLMDSSILLGHLAVFVCWLQNYYQKPCAFLKLCILHPKVLVKRMTQ